MLKRKLQSKLEAIDAKIHVEDVKNVEFKQSSKNNEIILPLQCNTCPLFSKPTWQNFFDIECNLNTKLNELDKPVGINCIYNPVEYAVEIHCAYLRQYLTGTKRLVFIGMNPGPNGMGQTGVPFGNIATVRDLMNLSGDVQQPPVLHPKRPISGMACKIEEPSGVRIWSLFQKLACGSLNIFAQQCFVHNFCPLAFFSTDGKNITPSELKGDLKMKIRDLCLQALDAQLMLLRPEIVVAVGDYVFTALKKSEYCNSVKYLRLPHPSPRALNNQNWSEKAEKFLKDHDLIKYLRNEI